MTGLAVHHDIEAVGRRQGGTVDEAEAADGHLWVVMEAQRHIDLRPVHHAVGDHGAHAADGFFGWLEHQLHGSGELRRQVLQQRGDAEQGGRVYVVAAGVHQAGVGAGEGQAGRLLDRQRVHIRSDCQHWARAAAVNQAYDAGFTHLRLMLDAEPCQFGRDDARGANLLEGEFGMGMDVAPDLYQLWLDPLGELADRGGGVVEKGLGHGSSGF